MAIEGFENIAVNAERAGRAHQNGQRSIVISGVRFDLVTGRLCQKFARQCVETGLGLGAFGWEYARGTARDTEEALDAAGLRLTTPVRGCVVGLNNQSYYAGHTAILLGPDGHGTVKIAHNTSNADWPAPTGPGTKITPISAVLHELSGYFAPTQELLERVTLQIVLLPGSKIIKCLPHYDSVAGRVTVNRVDCLKGLGLPDDPSFKPRVGIRTLLEPKGYTVTPHLDQFRVYLRRG